MLDLIYKAKYQFQSYQFRQINPDFFATASQVTAGLVSIVSIQADQSRRVYIDVEE